MIDARIIGSERSRMSCNCESSVNVHWCILHIHTSECFAHLHFHIPNLFLCRFLTILTLSMVKDSFFVFRHTLSHFEKSSFRMHLLFMLTNFEYHRAKFQIVYKTTRMKKAWYIIDNLDCVKKHSKFLYNVSFENTEGGPLFCAPVKFQDYYQYTNK